MADALPRGGNQLDHAVASATLVPCLVVPAGGCSALARIVCHHCCRNLLTSCNHPAAGLVIPPHSGLPGAFAPVNCDHTHNVQVVQPPPRKLSTMHCLAAPDRASLAHYASFGWHRHPTALRPGAGPPPHRGGPRAEARTFA